MKKEINNKIKELKNRIDKGHTAAYFELGELYYKEDKYQKASEFY